MTKSQTYDAGTVLPACRAALTKLRETERPGEGERLRKRNVLEALRPEITAMLRDGYSVRQIAAALAASGNLQVRPKTITEVCGGSAQPPAQGRSRARKRKPAPGTAADNETPAPPPRGGEPEAAATTPSATTPATGTVTDRSTFPIIPDNENL
jgi:hypothetical protein